MKIYDIIVDIEQRAVLWKYGIMPAVLRFASYSDELQMDILNQIEKCMDGVSNEIRAKALVRLHKLLLPQDSIDPNNN